jgi:serine/threonine/tyrosine-interacting protein
MSTPMSEDQLRAVIQGPIDVEWRSVLHPFLTGRQVDHKTTVFFRRYEMRRECQEILPGLLLGPFVASKSLETLLSLGVTHMYITSLA